MDAATKRWPHWVLVGVVAAVVVYLVVLIWDHAAVIAWMERARPIPFFLAMAILPALALPLTPFLLLAGATFGAGVGLVGAMLAIAGNLTLCWAIGRAGRSRLTPFFRRLGYTLPDFDQPDRGVPATIRFTTLFKLTPIPNFVKNYGLGAANVPYPISLVVTLVISGAYAFGLIVLGHSIFQHDLGAGTIALILLAAIGLFVVSRASRTESSPAHGR